MSTFCRRFSPHYDKLSPITLRRRRNRLPRKEKPTMAAPKLLKKISRQLALEIVHNAFALAREG
ncbi:MAG: hypothetical protein IJ387_09090, partial [Thermoguttaceae bacterium]|nr:hypothetical protein [Thermoguttaceae bacterium]